MIWTQSHPSSTVDTPSSLCTCLQGPTVRQAALWNWRGGSGAPRSGGGLAVFACGQLFRFPCEHSAVGVTGEPSFLRSESDTSAPKAPVLHRWAGPLQPPQAPRQCTVTHSQPPSRILYGARDFLTSIHTSLSLNRRPKPWRSVGCSWSHKCAFWGHIFM